MNNNLKITVTTNVQQANSSLKQFQQTLQGTGNTVSRVGKIFDKEGNLISKTIVSTEQKGNKLYRTIQRLDGSGNLRNLSQSMTNVKTATDNTTNAFLKLKSAISFSALVAGIKMVTRGLFETTTKAIDYSESLNLFNVVFKNIDENGKTTFSEVGKQATEFQEKLQSNFGANRTESMYYQGLYQAMANAQGIADQYAYIMSENSTKLTYDLSSLFNKNQEDVAEALRAGIYAGQTKPLRSYGIDITETTLQGTLDKMKETNSALKDLEVSTMSQAEKQILRYISVLEQASVAHGDFANTINSPANQLKILQNQIIEMGVAVGNLFLGPLQKLLTFANTVVIVIKQVAKAIASLFGVKIKDYNTGIATATDYADDLSDSYSGVGDSAGKASKKLKELNRQALAFDNINNINENKNNNGSSGKGSGAGGTGINQALLDSLKGYDNGLDKVRLKAQEIADTIMRWLGFTYDAEEGVWKLGKAYDNLIASCKNLGKALDTLGKYSFVNLINFYQNFLKPVASWTLGTGLPKFVDITANGIMQTDWANLNDKLNNFYKALAPFSINIGEGLLWFYEKVLTPLGSFTIGKIIPEFIQLLASGLNILNNTIDVMKPAVNFLWDNFLSPIAKWTGGIAVDVLQDINSLFNLIAKNKVASTVTALGTAFLLIKSNGGLANSVLKIMPKHLKLLFANAEMTAEILGDKKATGLTKAIITLRTKLVSLISPLKDLKFALNDVNYSGKSTFKGLSEGINLWSETSTKLDKFKTTLIGISGTILSLKGISNTMEEIGNKGLNASNGLQIFCGTLGTTASMALMGAQHFGTYGLAIGGILGVLTSLNVAISSMPDKYDKVSKSINKSADETLKYTNQINKQREAINETLNSELSNIQIHKKLYSELTNIVDANGKIQKGNEERAQFIVSELNEAYGTEYKVIDGVIQQYSDLTNTVQKLINKKTAEIVLEQEKQKYYNALKSKVEDEKVLLKAREDLEKAEKNLNDALKEQFEVRENLTGSAVIDLQNMKDAEEQVTKMEEAYKKASDAYSNASTTYSNSVTDIQTYQELLVAVTNNNYDEMNKIVESWSEKNYITFANTIKKETEELNGGEMSKALQESWKILAEKDYTTYKETIEKMPETTRKNIQKITGTVIEKTPEVEKTSSELGKKMIKSMKKDKEAKETGTEIIKEYLNGLSKKEQRQLLEDCGVKNVEKVMNGLKKGNLSENVGIQVVQGLKKGLDNNYWQGQTLNSASTFASNILNKWKKIFDIHSPSHATEGYGINLLKGYGVGFDKEQNNIFSKAEKFSNTLLENMNLNNEDMNKSLNFNANKLINFSEINGSISNKTRLMMDYAFIDQLGNTIANAINNRPIDVNVNATVDEGVVVKKAVKGINRITETTGECPIRVM